MSSTTVCSAELIDAVKSAMKKEQAERLRDVYLIGDIEKDVARSVIERIRELANEGRGPITLYINTAGGNVTDGLAIHDAILDVVSKGIPGDDRRAGDGLFDGVGHPPGGEPRTPLLASHTRGS